MYKLIKHLQQIYGHYSWNLLISTDVNRDLDEK